MDLDSLTPAWIILDIDLPLEFPAGTFIVEFFVECFAVVRKVHVIRRGLQCTLKILIE